MFFTGLKSNLTLTSVMTLLSSHLFPFSAVHRRSPATSTTINHFPWNKPRKPNDTVKFLHSPLVQRGVLLDERFVTRFNVPANAPDLIHNIGATVGVLGGAYGLVFSFDDLTRRNILDQVMVWFGLVSSIQFLTLHAYINIGHNFQEIYMNW